MRLKVGDTFPNYTFNTGFKTGVQVKDVLHGKTVFWCIRYIGCTVCRYDVHSIMTHYDEIKAKGAQVFVVMQSDQKHIQAEFKEGELPFDIICDPEMQFYKGLEINPAASMEELAGGPEDQAKLAKKGAACKELGYVHGDYEGDELQLPALFIVDEKGKCTYVKYGENITALPTVEELLELL